MYGLLELASERVYRRCSRILQLIFRWPSPAAANLFPTRGFFLGREIFQTPSGNCDLTTPDEAEPVGIILCSGNDGAVVEYALASKRKADDFRQGEGA
ncbi:MAG TPA: hypothetical protein VGX78_05020, partial [Pirellulales bacterium]|nr:hypothetical protein [Pirellulales bacterium]